MASTNPVEMPFALPNYLKPFKYQIAGHCPATTPGSTGFLVHENEMVVWKPFQSHSRGITESLFYEIVWSTDHEDNDEMSPYIQFLRMVIPRFHGVAYLDDNPEMRYLQLENVLYGYHYPCIMDVKVGRQTWPPTSSKERITYEKQKYPHLDKVGFRVLGMSVYEPSKCRRLVRNKEWGKQIQPDNIDEVLDMFFSGVAENPLPVAQFITDRLDALHAWFSHQDKFLFYTSSVLIVYEAGKSAVDDIKADLRLIDFTHVYPSPEGCKDDNYLYGLNKLLECLKKYSNHLLTKRLTNVH